MGAFLSTGRSSRRQSEGIRWESVLVLCAILVGIDLVCLFSYGPDVLPPLIFLETGLAALVAWKLRAEKLDREERLHRQRSAGVSLYHSYLARDRPSDQEAEDLEAHRAEERTLRVRIAELEDQLAQARGNASLGFSEASESPGEKEKPEVVAVLEVRRAVRAKEGKFETKATGKGPVERGVRPPGAPELRTEEDELEIRRKAIGVLLAALDDAVGQGILTQEEYKAKRSKYGQELRRIDKSLKASSQEDAVS